MTRILLSLLGILSVVLLPVASYGGLVAYYDFEGDVLDNSTEGNNGAINGDPDYQTETPTPLSSSTNSLYFDGTDDRVEVLHDASLGFTGGKVTVSMWMKSNGGANYARAISKISTAGFEVQRKNNLTPGQIRVDTSAGTNQIPGGDQANLWDGTWHHLVFTLHKGTVNVWRDGTQVTTNASYNHGTGFSNTASLFVGGTSGSNVFTGHLDDVAVWDEALQQSHVTHLYNGGSPLTAIDPLTLVEDDFNDNRLDTDKWSTVIGTGSSMGSPTVTERNQRLEMEERGYLVTKNQYDPAALGGLHIEGVWGFTGRDDDMMQILTRSDAVPAGNYGETQNGVEFYAFQGNATIRSKGGVSVTNVVSQEGSSFSTAAGTVFDFVITDDGTNLTLSMQEQSDSDNWATVTAESTSDMTTDFIVFHNREAAGRMSYLGEVRISVIPEPSTLALTVLGLVTLARRRRHRRAS